MKINYFIAFILGIICSFGQPPFESILASLISLGMFLHLLILIDSNKKIYFSFFFGYGYFIYSVHWFSDSLLTYGDKLLWLMPFGLLLMPAFFALYFAIFGWLISKLNLKNYLYISLVWISVELIRSYLYIEFPWILIGYIWFESKVISQVASVFGIWGLSFLTIIWAYGVFETLKLFFIKPKNPINSSKIILISMLSFTACYLYGVMHLKKETVAQDISIMLVQPNIEQDIDSRIKNSYKNLLDIVQLSKNQQDIDYVIWPEGANEFSLDYHLLNLIKQASPESGELIFSSTRIDRDKRKYWNSMFLINRKGEVLDYYDKVRLVPLGEFIPFKLRKILPFINKITPGDEDYTPGEYFKSIKTKFPFAPSICYEAAFPGKFLGNYTWLVNLTNDGWFGNGIGPYQHLAIAKFRSIELGVPMARSALTGISAIINSFGEVKHYIPLLKSGSIKAKLPNYLKNKTYYRKYENKMFGVLVILIFLLHYLIDRFFKSYNKVYNCGTYI